MNIKLLWLRHKKGKLRVACDSLIRYLALSHICEMRGYETSNERIACGARFAFCVPAISLYFHSYKAFKINIKKFIAKPRSSNQCT